MKRIQALLAVSALAVATVGQAATIKVTWNDPIFNPPSADSVSVSITAPAFSIGDVNTGRFKGTLSEANPAGILAAFPDAPTIYAYCYDLLETLNPGSAITYNVNSIAADPDVLNFLGAANAYLSGGVLAWLNPTAVGIYTAAEVASAIQLGIWEGLYEGGTFDLAADNLKITNVNTNVEAVYDAIILLLGSADLAASNVIILSHDGKQDVITGTDEEFDTPEPGILVLLGFAAAAAGVARRRTR